jgi:replicative DNA helicase
MDKLTKKSLEKLPPYNLEAEQAILGAILLDNTALHKALEIFDPEDFYRKSHRKIFTAMLTLIDRGDIVDLLLLRDELERRGDLDEIGGPAYLAALVDQVPTAANIEFHAKIVHEKAVARNLLNASIEIATRCYDDSEDVGDILADAEQKIFAISEGKIKRGFTPLSEIVKHGYERIEELAERKSLVTGVPTGFIELDHITSGLQPSDLIIIAARPSMGKCLSKDSEVVLSDGSIKTIQKIVTSQTGELLSLGNNFKLHVMPIAQFVDDGIKPIFQVTTKLGRSITTTASHPFLTIQGWKPLYELSIGDKIAVSRRIPIWGNNTLSEGKIKLIAYFIGDGCLTTRNPLFTNTNDRVQQDFIQAISESFDDVGVAKFDSHGTRAASFRVRANTQVMTQRRKTFGKRLKAKLREAQWSYAALATQLQVSPALVCFWCQGGCAPSQSVFSKLCQTLAVREEELIPTGIQSIQQNSANSLTLWLQELHLWGHTAHTKAIPSLVFTLSKSQLALFLNRLFATDGWASIQNHGSAQQIGYVSVCEKLIRQIQHLLLRFGIISSIREKQVKYQQTRRKTWSLQITHAESLKVFIDEIGIFGKEDVLAKMKAIASSKRIQSNTDHIPVEIWGYIRTRKGTESWGALARRAGIAGHSNIHVGKRALSRKRLSLLATALQDQWLIHLAKSDIYWDQIVLIEAHGEGQVYDLTIPSTHNFVANDICVHNTSLCLNIAQHVGVKEQIPTAVFSLEMSKEQLGIRLLCAEARLNSHDVRIGKIQDGDWDRLAHALEILSNAPIYIDDTPAITILEMRAKAKRLMLEKGLGIVIVDYLQLMQTRTRHENRQQEITEISRSLKTLAKELDVPVIALSQLSRAVEQRTDKRPVLSDLRESGSIEQDADVVMFIYRPEIYGIEGAEGLAELIVGKQRNGPVGSIQLAFIKEYTRFENLDRHHRIEDLANFEVQRIEENPF